jgi:hypothetical protein
MFIKMSLLFLYLRLSPDKGFRIAVYAMIGLSIAFSISSIFASALQCIPVSMLWNPNQPGHCIDVIAFYYANAAINIVTDVIIYVLPIRVLWGLQLPKRQRLGLAFLFSLGGVVVVASMIRIVTLHQLIHSTDPTWALVSPFNWSTIELHLGIFVTCGPAFKAFFRRYIPRLLGGSSYRRSTANQLHPGDPHYGSYPLGSKSRAGGETKTVITAISCARQPETESEEDIVLPYHGIMRETSINVHSDCGSVEPGTAK